MTGSHSIGPTLHSSAQPQGPGHNTQPVALSSHGQMLDTSMIIKAVNQEKHGGKTNQYVKFDLEFNKNCTGRQSRSQSNSTTIGYSSASCNSWSQQSSSGLWQTIPDARCPSYYVHGYAHRCSWLFTKPWSISFGTIMSVKKGLCQSGLFSCWQHHQSHRAVWT